MALILILVSNLWLGITLAAPPGPVSVEMIRRGLNYGFWASFIVRLGGALGNSVYLLLFYYWTAYVELSLLTKAVCLLIGSFVLFLEGWKNFKRIKQIGLIFESEEEEEVVETNGLLVGLIISLTNPMGISWWLSYVIRERECNQTALWLHFFIIWGVLLWGAFLAFLAHFAKRFMNVHLLKAVSIIASISLFAYAFRYAKDAYDFLLQAFSP